MLSNWFFELLNTIGTLKHRHQRCKALSHDSNSLVRRKTLMKGLIGDFLKSSWAIFPDQIWLIYNPNLYEYPHKLYVKYNCDWRRIVALSVFTSYLN